MTEKKKEHTKLGWCGELGVDLEEEGDWDQGTCMDGMLRELPFSQRNQEAVGTAVP